MGNEYNIPNKIYFSNETKLITSHTYLPCSKVQSQEYFSTAVDQSLFYFKLALSRYHCFCLLIFYSLFIFNVEEPSLVIINKFDFNYN